MNSVEEIYKELQKIDGQVSDSTYGIRHIGELASESMSRVQCDFSDQQAGLTLINALSLIRVSCENAANSMGQVSMAAHDIMSRLKQ